MDFTRVLHIVLRRFWLIMLCMLLTLGAGIAYLLRTPKVYTVVTTVQVEQNAHDAVSFHDSEPEEDYRSAEILKTFEQVFDGGTLLLRVAKVNHLPGRPGFLPRTPGGPPLSDSEIIERMQAKVSVELRRSTRLIDISVDDTDPVLACQLARSMVEEYRQQEAEQNLDVLHSTSAFLLGEEKRLKTNLEASEQALAKYRQQNQAVSLQENQNIVVEKLKELNQQVTDAKGKRLTLEADVNKLQALGTDRPEELLSLASIATVPEVADLRRQINEKEGEFAAVKQRYMYKHIKYIEAESNLQKLHTALDAELRKAADLVTRSYQGARGAEDNLTAALHEQEGEALKLDTTAIPYLSLQRQAESDRVLYENVLGRLKESGVSQPSVYNLRVVAPPLLPSRPAKPARLKILLIALAAGLILGMGAVFVLELFNHTLQTVDQAEQALGLPLLATVPEWKGGRRTGAGIATDPPHREAFRTLRTTLATIPRESEARSFLFTSAVPDEGKSFCALNLAVSLAEQGCHTLLINADLRRPYHFEKALEYKGEVGLSECLAGTVPLAQAVCATKVPGLFFCPAGARSDNPTKLLTSARFSEMLRGALQVFDRVVIDTPPINAVSDCLLLAPHVDSVCLVVRALSTPIKAVWRAGRLLTMAHVTPTGFVLNRLPIGLGAKYTHYYYGEAYFREEERQRARLSGTKK